MWTDEGTYLRKEWDDVETIGYDPTEKMSTVGMELTRK